MTITPLYRVVGAFKDVCLNFTPTWGKDLIGQISNWLGKTVNTMTGWLFQVLFVAALAPKPFGGKLFPIWLAHVFFPNEQGDYSISPCLLVLIRDDILPSENRESFRITWMPIFLYLGLCLGNFEQNWRFDINILEKLQPFPQGFAG